MENNALLATCIFICAYILIVSEKIHRTVVALVGAVLMILTGILSQEIAVHHIDFNTLGLLIGMMIIVNITSETGLFNFLAIWSAQKVKGEPVKLLIVLSLLTAVCSAFLDNVTTVLLTVPVTFSITSQLKVSPKPFLIAQILASNIGGAATLIGDPPNIMIGSAVKEMNFLAFLDNLGIVSCIILIVTVYILTLIYRKLLCTEAELKAKIMSLNAHSQITKPQLLKKCLAVLAFTILLFATHNLFHLETATVALTGASLLLAITFNRNEEFLAKIFSKIEWLAIFFFAGLFMLVGALIETGVIQLLAEEAIKITEGNVTASTILILWLSAIASAFIDNIPFVATMIPLIKGMGVMGMTNLEPLWWSLALGACLGGNGTLVGASANVIVAGMAAQRGHQLSFIKYMYIGFPIMLLSVLIANIYIYCRYL